MNVFDLSAKISLDSTTFIAGMKNAAKVAGVAMAAATAAVGAFAVKSIKVGQEFDKAMSQVAATSGKTMEELALDVGSVDTAWGHFDGNLREYAKFLGSNTAFSATQAAEALNYMALAGYDTMQSMEMMPNVLNLAAAGSMELARASDMVTDTQTAFGISAARTTQMVDEMAKTASVSNTSVEQLGDAFLTVGGLAKELNGGMITLADGTQAEVDGVQELEIALGAMANAGIKGSEAGTHMRNMLLKLTSPTKQGAEQLAALGVNVFDAEGNMRSLHEILGDTSAAMANLTQEEKLQAIADLFNTRDIASAEALLAAVESDWDGIGEKILDAEGAADKMAKTQLDNLAGDITLFKSALEGAQIAISDELTPALRGFVQFGTDGLSKLTAAFQEDGLSGAMEVFGTFLSDGLNMIIEGLPQFVQAGMQLLGALGQGLLDNLPVIVDSAVQVITMLVTGLIDAAPQLFEAAIQLITALGTSLMNNAPQLLESASNLVTKIYEGVKKNLPQVMKSAQEIVQTLMQKVTQNLPNILQKGVEIVSNIANGIVKRLPAVITAFGNLLSSAVSFIMQNLPTFWEKGTQLVLNIVNGIVSNLPAIINSMLNMITNLIKTIVQNLPQFLQKGIEIVGKLAAGLIQAIPKVVSAIWQIPPKIFSVIGSVNWLELGAQIIRGIVNGLLGGLSSVVSAISNVASNAVAAAKSKLGIASPSRVFRDQIGKMVSEGFALGIEDGERSVLSAIEDLSGIAIGGASVEGFGGVGGFTQNITINSPKHLSPYEVARQTKNETRGMMLAMRTA